VWRSLVVVYYTELRLQSHSLFQHYIAPCLHPPPPNLTFGKDRIRSANTLKYITLAVLTFMLLLIPIHPLFSRALKASGKSTGAVPLLASAINPLICALSMLVMSYCCPSSWKKVSASLHSWGPVSPSRAFA
jgi:hypothetical protein